ncbi:MAG: DUF2723 domain-containing protein [Ignavibacteria bacterium]|nr:DUF2723 domain-containing protein [Ignavibacteria bacterium]
MEAIVPWRFGTVQSKLESDTEHDWINTSQNFQQKSNPYFFTAPPILSILMSATLRASLIVGVATCTVYILTQAPGLFYTDVGELAAACKTWGVAHPTGYPLFTLIGHVWTFLPWLSAVEGLNLLVAMYTAAAAALMVPVVRRIVLLSLPSISERTALLGAVFTAALFSVGSTVWSQSTAVEVYSLNLLLFVGLLHFLLLLHSNKERIIVNTVLAGIMFGFMLANHVSSVFLLPGVIWMWWGATDGTVVRKKALPWLMVPMIVGPSLYALLPLRSAQLPPINWGMVHRGFAEFIYHVKGTQFGVWMFSDASAVRENLALFITIISQDFLWVGWIVIVMGAAFVFAQKRSIGYALLAMSLGNLGISLGYAIPDIESYFLPTIVVFTIFFGAGISWLTSRLRPFTQYSIALLPIVAFMLHFKNMDYSEHFAVDAYTRWAFINAGPNAIIITRQWDYMCSAAWYLQTVEHYRPDAAIIDKELLRRTWYAPYLAQMYPDVMKGAQPAVDSYMPWLRSFEYDNDVFMSQKRNTVEIQRRFVDVLKAIIEANPTRPVYITPEIFSEERGFTVGYKALPVGPLLRLTKDATLLPKTQLDYLEYVTSSLNGRTSRLDSALTQTVLSALYNDAMFTLEQRKDTAGYWRIRQYAISLDPKSRVVRMMSGNF